MSRSVVALARLARRSQPRAAALPSSSSRLGVHTLRSPESEPGLQNGASMTPGVWSQTFVRAMSADHTAKWMQVCCLSSLSQFAEESCMVLSWAHCLCLGPPSLWEILHRSGMWDATWIWLPFNAYVGIVFAILISFSLSLSSTLFESFGIHWASLGIEWETFVHRLTFRETGMIGSENPIRQLHREFSSACKNAGKYKYLL